LTVTTKCTSTFIPAQKQGFVYHIACFASNYVKFAKLGWSRHGGLFAGQVKVGIGVEDPSAISRLRGDVVTMA
jgi:hypothetical protein